MLGLSITRKSRDEIIAVGVVFRGNSWLDGVISCKINPTKRNSWLNLSRAIEKSKQYSQLHAIILSQTALRSGIDITDLSDRLKLPVVAIITRNRPSMFKKGPHGTKHYNLLVNGKRRSILAKRVTFDEAQEIFNVGCKPDLSLPEATRVADLITNYALD